MFSAFKKLYSMLKISLHSVNFLQKNITIGPRSRYRKILPAAVANQMAGKGWIPPAHEQKINKYPWFVDRGSK